MELRILGPIEVGGTGRAVGLGGRRERALLAALVTGAGEVVATDRLVDALWRDEPPRTAAKTLQNYVLRLRKMLGASAIETCAPGYRLVVPADAIDARRFEELVRLARTATVNGAPDRAAAALREALGLWRGPPLEELDGWAPAEAEVARLCELGRVAEEELMDAELACGRHAAAVAELEAMVAAEPLRERRWGMLMLALYRCGQQADALRAYQRARTVLAEQLGLEPGPELRALEHAVVTQDPALDAPTSAREPTRTTPPVSEAGIVFILFSDLAGSTELLDRLGDDAADELRTEHFRLLRDALAAHEGREVKSLGDGLMVVFASAVEALGCALDMQRAVGARNRTRPERLAVRIGLHVGEPIRAEEDFFGTPVVVARRLCDAAPPGGILASELVRELVGARGGFVFDDVGAVEVKGLRDPVAAVEVHDEGEDADAGPRVGTESPYKGLVAFEPEDRQVFFGREVIVDALVVRLRRARFLAVVGASGNGKSSVVRAGVLAAIHQDPLAGNESWSTILMSPGVHPVTELQTRRASVSPAPVGRLLVVIDQFEELFTLCRDDTERQRFVDTLVDAVTETGGMTTVVVALRADFYGHCASYPELGRLLESGTALLGPMRAADIRAAIEGPARVAGLRLEPGLVELIVRDVADEPGNLPLLSHALLETWKRRRRRRLTVDGYRDAGGVHGAIAHTAETVYSALNPGQQALARNIFLRLTELGEGTEDTRRRVARAELVGDAGDSAELDRVLDTLTDARLVTVGETGVEVAHEALIRQWPRLRGWLDDDRESLRIHRHLTHAADDWAALDRNPAELYGGPRLAAADEWADSTPAAGLNPLEREFLSASRSRQQQEASEQAAHLRRLRRLLAGVAIALVIALAAGTFAVVQRSRADDKASAARDAEQTAQVGRLVSESGVLGDRDRTLSALLAITANRLDDSAATRGVLQKVLLSERRLRATLTATSQQVSASAYTPDGRQIVVRGADAVDVFDARRARLSGRRIRLPGPEGEHDGGLAISPDGTIVAAGGGGDHRVHFFDIRSRREVGAPLRPAAPILSVAFSPDGATLATAAGTFGDLTPAPTERSAQLWDVSTRQPIPVPIGGHTASVNAVAFSPDGKLLATGGSDDLVVVHDLFTGATVGTPMHVGGAVYSLAFSPDSSRLAVGAVAPGALVFDVGTGVQVGSLDAGSVSAVAFSPDGSRLVTSNRFRNTILWDAATFTAISTPMVPGSSSVTFRPDGNELAVARSGTVTLWDPDAAPLFTRRIPGSSVSGSRYSPDGTVLAVPETDAVTLYDARTVQPMGPPLMVPGGTPLTGLRATPAAIAFSSDSKRLAVAGLGATVDLFDVATLRHAGPSVPLGSPALSTAFSPDGKMLAVGGTQGDLYLVDLPSGRRRGPLPLQYTVFNEAFSPDGRRLVATTSGGTATVYDHLRRDEPRATPLPEGRGVTAAQFSPDGSLLVTGTIDGNLQLRDGRTLRPLRPLIPTNQSPVVGIAVTRDGRLLAASDLLGTLRLVDVPSRQPIGDAFIGAGVYHSFRPDGRILATSADGAPALMTLDIAEWRAEACKLAGRNLTPAESRKYLGTAHRRVVACPGAPTPR